MLGDTLPSTDHVSRYCPRKHVDGVRITGAAFQLRGPTEKRTAETYLSVNWLEIHCCGARDAEIAVIRRLLANKPNLHKKDRIAVGQVGEILENVIVGSSDGRKLSVLHEPEASDASHSGLYGLKVDDALLYGELIAEMCQESYPARGGKQCPAHYRSLLL